MIRKTIFNRRYRRSLKKELERHVSQYELAKDGAKTNTALTFMNGKISAVEAIMDLL